MIEKTSKALFIEQELVLEGRPKVYIVANSAEDALEAQERIERKGGIRLTNAMRESILAKVYDFKFKKSGQALDKQELRLSHKAMVAAFGKETLAALAKIGPPYAYPAHDKDGRALPPDHLVEWKGTKVQWRVGELGYQIQMYVKDPLPAYSSHSDDAKFFTVKPGALADDIVAWQEGCTEWIMAKRAMANTVNAVLTRVTTFNSLQTTWPDGERFYKHIPVDFPFRNQVPAVKIDKLNAALGLA